DVHTIGRVPYLGLRHNALQGLTQLVAVIREIERDLAGGGEDRGAAAGSERFAEMAIRGSPRRHQIGGLKVHVIKKVGDKTVGYGGGWTSARGRLIAFFIERRSDHGRDERSGRLLHRE